VPVTVWNFMNIEKYLMQLLKELLIGINIVKVIKNWVGGSRLKLVSIKPLTPQRFEEIS